MFFLLRNSQLTFLKRSNSLKQKLKIILPTSTTTISKTFSSSTPPVSSANQQTDSYFNLYEKSLENPDKFWGDLASERLEWMKTFDSVNTSDTSSGKHEWFAGGQLNASVNCLDRHVRNGMGKHVALIWETDEPGSHVEVTYQDLLNLTCKAANTLKKHGVKKGDNVCIYMPVSPIAVATMLACTRIGAVHSVVFAGFSAEALASRINDSDVSTVVTSNESIRGGKKIPLKKTVDQALEQCPNVKNVLVSKRTESDVNMVHGRDVFLEEAMYSEVTWCEPEVMESEDPLFILYTSGSTGKPKGLVHTHAGYLLYTNYTHQHVFDYQPGDIHSCVADIGWITGHSYVVYGPLSNGATTVLFESVPTYPDPGRYWEMVERLKITQFYGAPTAIRLLLKYGDEFVNKYDRSSLKVLGSVGEPINEEAWHWYHDVVGDGRCPIVDTWWQTETGGILLTPQVSMKDILKPGCPMYPFYGVQPVLLDEKGNELLGNDQSGILCLKGSTPGMARSIYGDHERYLDVYYRPYPGIGDVLQGKGTSQDVDVKNQLDFPIKSNPTEDFRGGHESSSIGMYFTGDGARRDEDGHYHITGRVDDVINVKGVRLGTAEVEDVLDSHPEVAEAAVVGYPHDIKGEGVYAYVTLKVELHESEDEVKDELRALVKKAIGGFAVPEMIQEKETLQDVDVKNQIAPGLPKTRSGKIMRRILRCVAANKTDATSIGDTSTLAEPAVVDQIIANHTKLLEKK